MKTLTQKQIAEIKEIKPWTSTRFHGNTKRVGALAVNQLKEIVSKKKERELLKLDCEQKTNVQKLRSLINHSLEVKGTNYFKILIEGNTGIYYASPVYQHSDYNKSRLFDKSPKNLKLMELFNKIVNK